jgi:hypothetical protein
VIELLLALGANRSLTDKAGKTALDYAVQLRHDAARQLLTGR